MGSRPKLGALAPTGRVISCALQDARLREVTQNLRDDLLYPTGFPNPPAMVRGERQERARSAQG